VCKIGSGRSAVQARAVRDRVVRDQRWEFVRCEIGSRRSGCTRWAVRDGQCEFVRCEIWQREIGVHRIGQCGIGQCEVWVYKIGCASSCSRRSGCTRSGSA
jgi:hypothetical protein